MQNTSHAARSSRGEPVGSSSLLGRAGNAAALKDAIDRGETDDKIPAFDPGAAPLGTDDESAGTPLPTATRSAAAQPQHAPADLAADPEGNERTIYRNQDRVIWPAIVGLIVVIAVIVAAVWYFGR